jgi:hypothetical protein
MEHKEKPDETISSHPFQDLGFGHSRNKKSEEQCGPEGLKEAEKKLSPPKNSSVREKVEGELLRVLQASYDRDNRKHKWGADVCLPSQNL